MILRLSVVSAWFRSSAADIARAPSGPIPFDPSIGTRYGTEIKCGQRSVLGHGIR